MFDVLCTHTLVKEYNEILENARIDKVTQPKKNMIIITVRKPGKNHSIILDASPESCHTRISNQTFKNPITPPNFCMLLRKYLSSARIASISAVNNERIINFDIEGRHPDGDLGSWTLSFEVMGKHSNLIFYDNKTKIILGSLKTISSTHREIKANATYTLPPAQNKIDIKDSKLSDLKLLAVSYDSYLLDKFLFENIHMVSPQLAKEIVFRVFNRNNIYVKELTDSNLNDIYCLLQELLYNTPYDPMVFYKNGELVDFYPFKLECLNLKETETSSLNEAIDLFYSYKSKQQARKDIYSTLVKSVDNYLKKLVKKLKGLKKDLKKNEKSLKYKLYGELLTANMYNMKKGENSTKVYNYYEDEYIEIPLKASLTPNENSQRYFKKYSKAKRGIEVIKANILKCENELDYLNSVRYSLDISELDELIEIKEELIRIGYLKEVRKKDNGKKREESNSKPMKFVSSDNITIYVGKNNKQNDFVTLRLANPNDLWFHTKSLAGSHVVVRNEAKIPAETISEAAMLSAYFSKGRHSGNVEVDYTEIKNVKKPKGAKPGMVIYDNYTTLFVTPDENVVKKLRSK
ncbi:NFACT RNA binding domain-containing protein [Proteinivorax hydrogeniformans]|uniref:Rqc2 homolog RqcH n=1 Tax=Proteinivorax hydrogeniformans TaxID=1826727 RepID=A0AAU8HPH4_9FIRM